MQENITQPSDKPKHGSFRVEAGYRYTDMTAEQVYDAWLEPEQVRRWMKNALTTLGLEAIYADYAEQTETGWRTMLRAIEATSD